MSDICDGKILKVDNMNGVQSALVIKGRDNHIYILTSTPTCKFLISDEGEIGERYNEKGEFLQK